MSTHHYRHPFALFLIFCFFLFGCETEPFEQNETLEEPLSLNEEFKPAFSLSNFEDATGHIIENIEVDWHTFHMRLLEGKKWYEFNVVQKQPIAYDGDGEIQGQFFTLLAHKNEDGIKFFVNKMLSFSAGEGYTYFGITDRHYHGMLYLYNLKGQVEYVHHYEKGELMSGIEDVLIDPHAAEKLGLATAARCNYKASAKPCSGNNCGKSGAYSSPTSPCGGRGNGGNKGGFVEVFTHHSTDWYNNRGRYSEYSHTQFNGITSEYVWVSRGGSSGGSSSRNSQNFAVVSANGRTYYTSRKPGNAKNEPYKLIKDNSLKQYPCVSKIIGELARGDFKNLRINNLGQLEGGKHLSKSILELFEKSSKYELIVKVAEAGYGINAHTKADIIGGKFTFTITLDDDYVNRGSKLAIARTLIHESVHAYLGYILQDKFLSSIALSLQNYRSKKGIKLGEHEFMTQYIDAIAHSLEIWDGGKLSSRNRDYYKYLAWSGDMQKSDAFNKLPESLKTKIKNANKAEGNAIQNSTSSSLSSECP